MAEKGPHHRPGDDKKKSETTVKVKVEGDFKTIDELKDGEIPIEYKINPIAFEVTWGSDQRYWEIKPEKPKTITLLQVSWLEVIGNLPMKTFGFQPKSKYKVTFRVTLKTDAFGWNGCPVYMTAKDADGKYLWKSADLSQIKKGGENPVVDLPFNNTTLVFTTPEDIKDDSRVFFGLYEIWRGRWKGGLQIHGAVIEKLDNKS